jgi:DNA-binding MarR family transcriptional regulator
MPARAGELDRAGNVLGAVALAVVDRVTEHVAAATSQPESAAAALSALHFFIERPSIDTLRRVLGLTSSGTVRLVDRLERDGLVTRRAGDDARTTFVVLTAAGRRAAERVARARAAVLVDALDALTARERTTFDTLIGKIAVGLMRAPGAVRWTCRLCDTDVCGRYEGRCPIGNAAAARHA